MSLSAIHLLIGQEIIDFINRQIDDNNYNLDTIILEITDTSNVEYEPADDNTDYVENDQTLVIDDKNYKKFIKKHKYNKRKTLHDKCCVCLENFKENQSLSTIKKCKHSFCVECLINWLKLNKSKFCPLCRTLIFVK
ncbi:orf82 [Artaxa digramma nucleopolyhedrovirus]|uniref:Orf82 n=1 Tax=Artaxa digramma nucleopolyhedrovirus TaxID=3070910 RepID=A0AAE6UZI8_9ABAC|nr:orf82 [Euproctis digramma nucleopolyhedrovirus]QHB21741.1 orf82 [Artaxa digramma nucleopolyhedrovirus]